MSVRLSFAIAAVLGWQTAAQAQDPAQFYRGKSISLLIAYTGGGNYDLHARVLAHHISKHIPGNPSVVPQNFVGAAGLRLANFLYNVAPKDGTTIGILARGSSTEPLLGNTAAQFDPRRYTWIGSVADEVSVCVSWHTSKVKTFEDMLTAPFVVGGQGPSSDANLFASLLRSVFGAKTRIVSGYPGTNEISLAMERGEVEGRCGWAWGSVKVSRADWLATKKINVILQIALQRAPDLPGVPLIMDLARNEPQRRMLQLMFSRQQMAWPFAAPPDLPAERTAVLRAAFDATMKDPDYLAEAGRRGLEVNPMPGAAMQALVQDIYDSPADVIAATKAAIAEGMK
jgi:tripartite-type tricarboxylate transporter receptor subunit TctC